MRPGEELVSAGNFFGRARIGAALDVISRRSCSIGRSRAAAARALRREVTGETGARHEFIFP
jgi:hypothetical protein